MHDGTPHLAEDEVLFVPVGKPGWPTGPELQRLDRRYRFSTDIYDADIAYWLTKAAM